MSSGVFNAEYIGSITPYQPEFFQKLDLHEGVISSIKCDEFSTEAY